MNERHAWLKSVWKSYLGLASGLRMGRVLSVQRQPSLELMLQCEGRSLKLTPGPGCTVEAVHEKTSLNSFLQILAPGDWLGFDQESCQRVCLLAPCLVDESTLKQKLIGEEKRVTLKAWEKFLNQVRSFFIDRDFVHLQTPTLVVCPGTEPYLDPFKVSGLDGNFYLPTSPELSHKKALARGLLKTFEIRPCFRAREFSERHRPEFWMLECYDSPGDLESTKQLLRNLVQFLAPEKKLNFRETNFVELFAQKLSFQLMPTTTREELFGLATSLSLPIAREASWDDLFTHIFVDQIEADLGADGPVILSDYPPSQAALARVNERGWADRFEFYWQGFEIANAFNELSDPKEQRRRADLDNLEKQRSGRELVHLDPEFFKALEMGLPPTGGMAVGLERLFMAITGLKEIGSLKVFDASN